LGEALRRLCGFPSPEPFDQSTAPTLIAAPGMDGLARTIPKGIASVIINDEIGFARVP
jgi:hypothetical protein